MKKLFVVMASEDKGRSWARCDVPFMQRMFMAEDQASAEAMFDKEYELFKKRKGKAKRNCFKIVEFSGGDKMKEVMISIKPRWCNLIANGEKTIEVRKTKPNIKTPFKCFVYCTNDRHDTITINGGGLDFWICDNSKSAICFGAEISNGKVIGEFVCDNIDKIFVMPNAVYSTRGIYGDKSKEMCLTDHEIASYLGYDCEGRPNFGYAWHIINLKIYANPKELSEFKTPPCEKGEKACENCKHIVDINTPNGHERECYVDDGKTITRPPQSWQYCVDISKIETTTKGEK